MNTWLNNELPEEWPENNTTSNSADSGSQHSRHSSQHSQRSSPPGSLGQTVAIQLQPDHAQEAQWKAALSPAKPNVDHLQGLFNDPESPPQDTSASESDLSSVAEQTRRLKLFTQTKNTYTNQRLDALATSLQGHHSEDEKSDIISNLMNDGNNALSRIRKASNLELRAVYEHENETSNENSVIQLAASKHDSSLDDLSHLDQSNGSTLSSLTDNNATTHSTQRLNRSISPPAPPAHHSRPTKSIESIQNHTVRFKTPMHTPVHSQLREPEVPSLAIPESSFDLEQRPFMSFVDTEYGQQIPLTTSASETSGTAAGTAIRPPARQVRRETMIHSRPPSSASQSADPRPYAPQSRPSQQLQQQQQPGTVRYRPSRGSTWESMRSNYMGQAANASAETSVDKVFDVSVAINSAPLRDISLPNVDDKNLSISRKNVSFSGSLFHLIQQVRAADESNTDAEIDLSSMELECLKGLDDLLPNLVRADLSHNCVQVVEGLPSSLVELDLSFNNLNRMTAFPLMFVTSLNVANNKLEDLTSLSCLRALSHLDVSNNLLKSLKGIETLHSLETLDVGENKLRSLKISHNKLRNLRAASNKIEAVELNTPGLEVLDLNNNSILSFEPLASVRKLSIRRNGAKMNFAGWDSLEELFYDGNTTALNLNRLNLLSLSWTCAENTTGFDCTALVSCQVLSIDKKSALKVLSGRGSLPIQQLNLSGMSLKTLPTWLPACLPHLKCLNLAFNHLDDSALQVISEFKELRTLGLFGNSVTSFASLTLCLGKLGNLGALDLRGNPVTNDLYPDMKTLLMDASNGSPGNQYDRLLGMDWNTVLDEWQLEPSIPQKFTEYDSKMKRLKLWWLDGAVVNENPKSNRVWTNPRATGIGAIKLGKERDTRVLLEASTATMESDLSSLLQVNNQEGIKEDPIILKASSHNLHAQAEISDMAQAETSTLSVSSPMSPEFESRETGEYDMRFKFQTPSHHNLFTPSRVTGHISTIGKARVARTVHSTPAPITNIPASDVSTPQTIRKPYSSRPLAKSMPRTRKLVDENVDPNISKAGNTTTSRLTAELTADFIVSLYKRQYAAAK